VPGAKVGLVGYAGMYYALKDSAATKEDSSWAIRINPAGLTNIMFPSKTSAESETTLVDFYYNF